VTVPFRAVRLAELQRRSGISGAFSAGTHHIVAPVRWRPVDYVEIMAVVDGEGRKAEITESGRRGSVRLVPGTVVLVRSGTQHVIEGRGARGMSVVIVSFLVSDWQTLAGFLGVDPAWTTRTERLPVVTVGPADLEVLRAFDAILECSAFGPSRLELARFLIAVLPLLLPLGEAPTRPLDVPGWLAASVEAMREEGNLRGGVQRLQELAHVSQQYLSTVVRRSYGVTASALVADLRLRHAATLLVTTRDTVAQIAARCGYNSPEYFATAFRHAHQVPPRTYRSRFTEV
jgi:AraC-like DNA-binding protein